MGIVEMCYEANARIDRWFMRQRPWVRGVLWVTLIIPGVLLLQLLVGALFGVGGWLF